MLRSSARALLAKQGLYKQIRRAIESQREPERARESQSEPDSDPERAKQLNFGTCYRKT